MIKFLYISIAVSFGNTGQADFQAFTLRRQILVLIKSEPMISKKEMSEILGISMYSLKKEPARMREDHVAEFVGYSRNGKWGCMINR